MIAAMQLRLLIALPTSGQTGNAELTDEGLDSWQRRRDRVKCNTPLTRYEQIRSKHRQITAINPATTTHDAITVDRHRDTQRAPE